MPGSVSESCLRHRVEVPASDTLRPYNYWDRDGNTSCTEEGKSSGVSSMFRSELAKEILSYLMDHPDAQDTKEGIVEWWVLHQRAESVDSALCELVEKGFLEEFRGADTRSHYRIAAAKRGELFDLRDTWRRSRLRN